MQSKGLSAGGTIKGWGNRLSVDSSYLNRYEVNSGFHIHSVPSLCKSSLRPQTIHTKSMYQSESKAGGVATHTNSTGMIKKKTRIFFTEIDSFPVLAPPKPIALYTYLRLGFITGGDFYARCSITTLYQYNKEETRRQYESTKAPPFH